MESTSNKANAAQAILETALCDYAQILETCAAFEACGQAEGIVSHEDFRRSIIRANFPKVLLPKVRAS